ncbi:MAG: PHP domain-containing protein [Planctomycetes bacterium]|nr:PHP domain-containing protein [Planctomycetota bacterium]
MPKRIMADLHVHTSCSDCAFTPREVVELAARAGLNMVAITDHDTTEGVAEAQQAGRRAGVEIIPGVEISAYHGEEEFHIIGLYVDNTNVAFLESLKTFRKARRDRIFEIVERLEKIGVHLDGREVLDQADSGSPTRAHVAHALVENGYADNVGEAFALYIGDSGPGFVPKRYMTVEKSISEIRSLGGVSILAHPGLTDRDGYIALFVEMGISGLEAFYSTYSRAQTRHYLDIAQRMDLLVSGGSDFHGKNQDNSFLGRFRVPAAFVEQIMAAARMLPGSIMNREQ